MQELEISKVEFKHEVTWEMYGKDSKGGETRPRTIGKWLNTR